MCECLKTLCRKLKKELSMNHLMDIVQYLGPDSDCLFIKEYSSLEDIPNSIYYGPCLWVENTFSLGDCIIQISKNQFVKYEKFCMLEASIIAFCIYYVKNLSYPQKYGQYLGLLQSLLTDTKFESNLQSEKLVRILNIIWATFSTHVSYIVNKNL